jgi:hypothetical protein
MVQQREVFIIEDQDGSRPWLLNDYLADLVFVDKRGFELANREGDRHGRSLPRHALDPGWTSPSSLGT